ncbi:MAG TPA: molybdopterin-dependent oxidoreductase [Gemmatimonadota bacterium]|nr:molybdopterin-dependent oxidoreductase [Gemmatimonadota bacterium]
MRPEAGRRRFLKAAAVSAAGLAAGGCGWRGGPFEDVLQWWWKPNEILQKGLSPPWRRAKLYPPGSESTGIPQYFISPSVPTTDAATWRLRIGGLVERPLGLSLDDLLALPLRTLRLRHYCIEGWTAIAAWTGVPLAHLAGLARAAPQAGYVEFRSFDSGYWSSWDRESALHPQTLIAVGMNGTLLSPGYGAPARLYSNLKYGYKSVKYLTEINFLADRTGGYWEARGYDWYAGL